MSKRRQVRQVLGHVARPDGVKVEVRQATVWAQLVTQQAVLEQTQAELERVNGELLGTQVSLVQTHSSLTRLRAHWWTGLGEALGLVPRALASGEATREAARGATEPVGRASEAPAGA